MSLDDFSKTTLLHAICTDYWLEATIIISSSRNYSEPHRLACVLQVSDAAFRLALVLDSFSPCNLDLMLLGWPGHLRRLERGGMLGCTPSAYYLLGTVLQPWRQWMFGLGYTPLRWAPRVPSSLPLLYTMMCTSPLLVLFKPSCSLLEVMVGAVYDQILLTENSSFVCLLLLLLHIIWLL
jgi:hypothetical protein